MNWWPMNDVVAVVHFVLLVLWSMIEHAWLLLLAFAAWGYSEELKDRRDAKRFGQPPSPPPFRPAASQTPASDSGLSWMPSHIGRFNTRPGTWTPLLAPSYGSELVRDNVQGVRTGPAAVVDLPAELTLPQITAFLDAVQRWVGPECQQVAFCRGRCTVVDQVGVALRDRGYDVTWVNAATFAQSGWLAVVR